MVPFGQPPKKEKKWKLNGKRISSNSELLVSIDFILVPSSDYPYGLLSWGLGVLYDKRVVFVMYVAHVGESVRRRRGLQTGEPEQNGECEPREFNPN